MCVDASLPVRCVQYNPRWGEKRRVGRRLPDAGEQGSRDGSVRPMPGANGWKLPGSGCRIDSTAFVEKVRAAVRAAHEQTSWRCRSTAGLVIEEMKAAGGAPLPESRGALGRHAVRGLVLISGRSPGTGLARSTEPRRHVVEVAWDSKNRAVDGSDVPEATAAQLVLSLEWRAVVDGSLEGEVVALNDAEHPVRVSGRPMLAAMGVDGEDLGVDMVVTAELRIPDFVVLGPGQRARAPVSWGGWNGPPCSGRFRIGLPGGRTELSASGPRQPEARGPATNLSSSWFERLD
jgi:hypothetical protein